MTALFVMGTVFAGIGALLITFPRTIRRYDTRMRRYIKDEEEYVVACRVLGMLFLLFALALIVMGMFPQH